MRAYEVSLNGKRVRVAGIGSDGYISAYITYRSEPSATWIVIMGLENRKKLYLRWTRKNLRVGDEVLLGIVDRKSVHKYKVIRPHDEKKDLESMKRDLREKAKALGLEIREMRKPKRRDYELHLVSPIPDKIGFPVTRPPSMDYPVDAPPMKTGSRNHDASIS
jgi:hypothetical protein